MTDQELFNQAVRVIINQGDPSINRESGQCVYRNSNGRKCVAGHFIPDEKYSPDMEEQAIFWRFDDGHEFNLTFEGIFEDLNVKMLGELQHIHDSCDHDSDQKFMSEWISQMTEFGKIHSLNLDVVEEYCLGS